MHVTRTIPAVLTATALVLTSCSSTEGGLGAPAALETHGDEVIQDTDGTGVEVSQRLFDSSETVVVSAKDRDQQLKAAAIAVKLGAPMLVRLDGTDSAVDAEVERLGATRVINVPGDEKEVEAVASAEPAEDAAAIAALDPQNPSELTMPPVFATALSSRASVATARAAGADVQVLAAPDPRATADSMRTVTEQDTLALGRQWGDTENFLSLIHI